MDGFTALISNNPLLGFIAVGTLAFMLGVLVTLLCHLLHKWSDDSGRRDQDW